jgi:serine/threonine-protein kinase HipA
MMTSDSTEAFVWAWLPGASDPVVAGRLDKSGETIYFIYARSYLARPDAIPLYAPAERIGRLTAASKHC